MKIYEPKGMAREYSPLAVNYYKGCTHNCVYCYVPRMFKRFNSSYDHAYCVAPDERGFAELEESARKMSGCGKQILLSFTGDPYCELENTENATRRVLETLLTYGHKVAILTKGGSRCHRDFDLFYKYKDRMKVGMTMTFDNEKDSLEWESGAATPEDRYYTLRALHELGIKTWISFEPVVYPDQALNVLEWVAPFVDHVKIGKLNNFKGFDTQFNWNDFAKKAVSICRENDLPFYIKKSLQPFCNGIDLRGCEVDQDYLNL